MPSQDDYLDELLKGMSEEENKGAAKPGGAEAIDLDAVTEMTEEDIARLLEAGEEVAADNRKKGSKSEEEADSMGDVLSMLEGTEDSDLQEIQDLLQKSDNKEAVDTGKEPEEGDNPADKLLADIERAENGTEQPDARQQRALEKKRKKEEKLAQKAAKKAEREAAKAAKGKKASKGKAKQKNNTSTENGQLFEKDVLDSIVSGASQIGQEDEPKAAEQNKFQMAAEDAIVELDAEDADSLIPDLTEVEGKEEESGKKEKAPGIFSKFMSFLMEEEEEPENEDIRLSEENQAIIDELDKEKADDKGKGKGKKKKKEKPKKEPKPKKPPKPKKEKPPKEEEPAVPGSKLTLKKVMPIILLGVSVGAVVLIFVHVSVDYSVKQVARKAYYEGDYETCYQNLFGRKLNDEEARMYGRSESILYIRQWYREYEIFAEAGMEVEALDSLIQTVSKYPALYEYAYRWDAVAEINAVYSGILNILHDKYGLTEMQALEIAAEESDREYTKIVTAVAGGMPYGSWNEIQPPVEEGLPNELPEESEMGNGNFVDNQ